MSAKTLPAKSATKSEYGKDHFILNRWILRGAGLWAPETESKIISFCFKCYAVVVFLFVNLFFTPTEFVSIKDTSKHLDSLIKNLSFALTHLLGAIKVLFWFYRNGELKRIIGILESEEYHYESTDEFRPAEIFRKAKRTGIKYTFTFYMMAHVTVSSSYVPPIIQTFTNPNYIENVNVNSTFYQPLPYYSWIPFKIDTPKAYLYALAYQMLPMFSYAYSIVGMDTLFMNILNLIGAHMSVLNGAFKSIKVRSTNKIEKMKLNFRNEKDKKYILHNMMRKEFQRSVKHLQIIFSVCRDLERMYKYLTLVQVLFTLFIFCTCLFLVSTTPITSKRFASEMVYMIAMGFQLMLYCSFGNEVTLKAGEIPSALWESDWLGMPYSYRSNMIITMIRMKRPLCLTAGKFAPLTLHTFVTILRGSYSFFAVLKQQKTID